MLLGNFTKNCGHSSFWLKSDIPNEHLAWTSICSCIIIFIIIIYSKWRIHCSLLLDRGARNWLTWCILVTSQSSKLVYLMLFLVQAARKVVTSLPPPPSLTCSLSPGETLLNQGHQSQCRLLTSQPLSDLISPAHFQLSTFLTVVRSVCSYYLLRHHWRYAGSLNCVFRVLCGLCLEVIEWCCSRQLLRLPRKVGRCEVLSSLSSFNELGRWIQGSRVSCLHTDSPK